jgi:hypothetical protein
MLQLLKQKLYLHNAFQYIGLEMKWLPSMRAAIIGSGRRISLFNMGEKVWIQNSDGEIPHRKYSRKSENDKMIYVFMTSLYIGHFI